MKKSVQFKFTADSNYLIAYLQSWNQKHEATVKDFAKRLARGEQFYLVPHTLTEAYSVMTRMPDPYRVSPGAAFELLADNFRKFPVLEHPQAAICWECLAEMQARSVSGGRSYDFWIARTAQAAGMHALVTWNAAHFMDLGSELAILTPTV